MHLMHATNHFRTMLKSVNSALTRLRLRPSQARRGSGLAKVVAWRPAEAPVEQAEEGDERPHQAPFAAGGAAWRPHSFCSGVSHHQRPARRSSPSRMGRVQGAHPMEG